MAEYLADFDNVVGHNNKRPDQAKGKEKRDIFIFIILSTMLSDT